MSLIRCLSNPESLYVWQSVYGNTCFSVDGNRIYFEIPTKLFETAVRRYLSSNDWLETFNYMGIRIETDYIDSDGKKNFGRIKLSYTKYDPTNHKEYFHQLIMWDVTWNYMIDRYRYEYMRKLQGKPNAFDIVNAIKKLHIKNSSYISNYILHLFFNYGVKRNK
jgi:hypothetical protein